MQNPEYNQQKIFTRSLLLDHPAFSVEKIQVHE